MGEGLADEIVQVWLTTDFEGGRHQRRIDQITDIENSFDEFRRGSACVSTEFDALRATDPAIASIIERETERQNTTIQLIASENFTSPAVLAAQGSVLTNKYSEGYPAKRYYGGNLVVDEAEDLARDRLKQLFGAEHANVQPHSGANANMAAFLALLEPGDKVMGMRLDQGGHLTHGSPVNFSGRLYDFVSYGVDAERRDASTTTRCRRLAEAERPKLIIAGATAYPRTIDFARFRAIADEVRRAAHGRRRAHRRAHRRWARTRRRSPTPTSSPPRRTRRCAARAPA